MRLLLYKSLILFLTFTSLIFGQKEIVLKKSFNLDSENILKLDLKNVPLTILESNDGKIHVDFSMEFKGFSKDEIKNEVAKVKFNKDNSDNIISLSFKSDTRISNYAFITNSPLSVSFPDPPNGLKNKMSLKKTKSDVLDEIKLKTTDNIFKEQIKNDKSAKTQKAHFYISIPKYLMLRIEAHESNIISELDVLKNLILTLDVGLFKGNRLIGSRTSISANNASLKIVQLDVGGLALSNVNKCLIGSIKNADITSELSKIEIGEIQENVKIQDFNSELFLYNFSDNFKTFELNAEYSKVNFYQPENDFSYLAIGNNTVNHFDNITVNMQPNKKGKKVKMVKRKKKGIGKYAGHILFDIVHGVIYSHSETFKPNKK